MGYFKDQDIARQEQELDEDDCDIDPGYDGISGEG